VSTVGAVLYDLLTAYLVLLLFRLVVDWVIALSKSFRPSGLLAAAFEVTYSVTDPPLRLLRRFIQPLRVGRGFAIDLSFFVLVVLVLVLRDVVLRL
jgi:YggT family protein